MMQDLLVDIDVVVLGAGAAGLMCALTAAQQQRRVLVLEKSNKVGKKILMSGGGRCNFTNYNIEAENYLSNNPHFCKAAFTRYTQWDFIALVEKHGIAYEERKHGQLFCLDSARDILTMLLDECERAGVTIKTNCEIEKVVAINSAPDTVAPTRKEKSAARYQVEFKHGKATKEGSQTTLVESVVVATGALSIPTLGGSAVGYELAQQFSLDLIERRAGLVPFMFSDSMKTFCTGLAGVSLAVEVSCNQQIFSEDLLFTHRGISGPVILQISNYWSPGDEICINLLPGLDVAQYLLELKTTQSKSHLLTVLGKKLGKSLSKELQALLWPKLIAMPLAEVSDKALQDVGERINNWRLKPSATEGYRTAEVTLGGVNTDAISSKTMAVKNQPGLYFIGEVLDVTGHLGGYNFQWAWSSGYSAGLHV